MLEILGKARWKNTSHNSSLESHIDNWWVPLWSDSPPVPTPGCNTEHTKPGGEAFPKWSYTHREGRRFPSVTEPLLWQGYSQWAPPTLPHTQNTEPFWSESPHLAHRHSPSRVPDSCSYPHWELFQSEDTHHYPSFTFSCVALPSLFGRDLVSPWDGTPFSFVMARTLFSTKTI